MRRSSRRRTAGAALSAALLAAGLQLGVAPGAGAHAGTGSDTGSGTGSGGGDKAGEAVPDGWIVVLKEPAGAAPADVPAVARELVGRAEGARLRHVYRAALHGFSARMTRAQAARTAADPRVALVRQDTRVRLDAPGERARTSPGYAPAPQAAGTQSVDGTLPVEGTQPVDGTHPVDGTQPNAPWGLDRIDQRRLPLSTTYTYRTTAPDVGVYVIDTGLRTSHREFGGRASVGVDTVGDGQDGDDCNGHGTHVGGVAAGTTYGVAKQARLVAVRVLGCQGSGTVSGVVAGVDWVTANAVRPAVANMSLGGGASDIIDRAVRGSIASGVTYTVSAGSSGQSGGACAGSPARVPEAVTVGGSDRSDRVTSSSNHGKCVSLFAPGAQITSAWKDGDDATATLSGTSMATAHAAGAAALHLGLRPADTPAQVKRGLVDNATTGVLQGNQPVVPDKLLHTLYPDQGGF
ncbi:S8 family peptidase [Streptomyces silvensis]|uniref:Serine protease n=1 Tax=Streptomyces silvensis TaxID=1765722 RepID=A0A0W7WXE1_9ACTN|nr:S8 family peptidase [Streptomyces silvensis]KUF15248.1 serine protease [Streptomyces silvensis]